MSKLGLRISVWIEPPSKYRKNYRVCWRILKGYANGKALYERGSETCGSMKAYARKRASDIEKEFWEGKLNLSKDIKTWQDFTKAYLAYSKSSKEASTYGIDERAINSFSEFLGNDPFPLQALESEHFEKWKTWMLERSKKNGEKYSPNGVNILFVALKAAFNYAVETKWLNGNPMEHVSGPKTVAVGRYLHHTEIETLTSNMVKLYRRACLFDLETGCRISEFVDLDWKQVDWHTSPWKATVHARKTGRSREIEITPQAQAVMGLPGHSGRVFEGLRADTLEHVVLSAARKTGIGRVRVHDFRHTWATNFMKRTGNIFELMVKGGWRSVGAVAKYQHITKEFAPDMPPNAKNDVSHETKNDAKSSIKERCVSG